MYQMAAPITVSSNARCRGVAVEYTGLMATIVSARTLHCSSRSVSRLCARWVSML